MPTKLERLFVLGGAVAGCGTVLMSAAAAHAWSHTLDARALTAVRSAIDMQAWHALALVLTGVWLTRLSGPARLACGAAGAAFACGILLFCGAVYAGSLGGVHLGPVAPTGGVLLMAGWLLLAVSAGMAAA